MGGAWSGAGAEPAAECGGDGGRPLQRGEVRGPVQDLQLGPGDQRGDLAVPVDGAEPVLGGGQHQRGAPDLAQARALVDPGLLQRQLGVQILDGGEVLVDSSAIRVTRSGAVRTSAIATMAPRDRPARAKRGGSSSSSRSTCDGRSGSVRPGVVTSPRSRPDHRRSEQFIPGSSTTGSPPLTATFSP